MARTKAVLRPRTVVITDHVKDVAIAREVLGEALADELHDGIEVAIVWRHRVDDAFLLRHPRIRGVVRYGAGFDNIDVEAATRHGVVACNNPAYGVDEVADTAVALILGLVRGIFRYDAVAAALPASWQANVLPGIKRTGDTTVGVVGAGRIGGSVLLKLRALGFRTCLFDPHLPSGMEKTLQCRRAPDLDALLAESDVVSLHAPLNAETAGMVDRAFLGRMKVGTFLVNTARGGLIASLDDIEDALRTGRLGGVGLDVLPEEPPRPGRLIDAWRSGADWLRGRCIINPHTAYFSEQSRAEMHRSAAETALAILKGVWPPNVLNPSVRRTWKRAP